MIFLKKIPPYIKGHAKLIDGYHLSCNSPYYSTVQHDRIQLHDSDADDPDWIVKQVYRIMIAGIFEVECGVENL